MHKFSQYWIFRKLHIILDDINKEDYNLLIQRKSLYLTLFANFGHQSMHQVLQGILTADPHILPILRSVRKQNHYKFTADSTGHFHRSIALLE